MDDIMVYNRTSKKNLDTVLNVLKRCRQHGITFNPEKFEFLQSSMDYGRYKVSCDGVKADPKKVEAIQNFLAPTNITELCSFMGLANQLGGFLNQLSKAAEPLRDSMKPKNSFL